MNKQEWLNEYIKQYGNNEQGYDARLDSFAIKMA